jgi:hypothetical protein
LTKIISRTACFVSEETIFLATLMPGCEAVFYACRTLHQNEIKAFFQARHNENCNYSGLPQGEFTKPPKTLDSNTFFEKKPSKTHKLENFLNITLYMNISIVLSNGCTPS